jgi:hypothetical protein
MFLCYVVIANAVLGHADWWALYLQYKVVIMLHGEVKGPRSLEKIV